MRFLSTVDASANWDGDGPGLRAEPRWDHGFETAGGTAGRDHEQIAGFTEGGVRATTLVADRVGFADIGPLVAMDTGVFVYVGADVCLGLEVVRVTKANYSAPAEADLMRQARHWHALVAGIGD